MSKKNEMIDDVKEVKRVTEYRRDTRLRSTFLKGVNPSRNLGSINAFGSVNNILSQNKVLMLGSNLKKPPE